MNNEKEVNHTKVSFSIQEATYEWNKQYNKRRIPKTYFKFWVTTDQIQNKWARGVSLMLRNLKLIFCSNFDFICWLALFKNCSADLVSVIEINKNWNRIFFWQSPQIFNLHSLIMYALCNILHLFMNFLEPIFRVLLCGQVNFFYWFRSFPHLLIMHIYKN